MEHGTDDPTTGDAPITAPGWLRELVRRQEDDDRLDAVGQKLTDAARPLTEGRLGESLRGDWLGHALHPLMTDLPLGCFTSSFVLDLIGGKSSRTASRRLVGLGLILTVPTMATGAVDYSSASQDPRIRRVGVVHGIGNLVAGMFYFRSWRSRHRGHHLRGFLWGALGGGLAVGTGYLGGHMSFARGAGVESRGLDESAGQRTGPTVDLTGDAAGDLLDIHEAAERLGVSVEDVNVMVEEQVLTPFGGDGTSQFRSGDVEAARMRGG